MKLEIIHIKPYLPYGLKITYNADITEVTGINTNEEGLIRGQSLIDVDNDDYPFNTNYWKPILRPKTDLLKEPFQVMLFNEFGEDYETIEEFNKTDFIDGILKTKTKYMPFQLIEFLCKHHFDIFELIENGLAIDINTLEK